LLKSSAISQIPSFKLADLGSQLKKQDELSRPLAYTNVAAKNASIKAEPVLAKETKISSQTNNDNADLLETIAENTNTTNERLESLTNAFVSFTQAFGKFGDNIGQKINTPAIQQAASTSGGPSSMLRSSEIAKDGNDSISRFRSTIETLRPMPA